MLLPRKNYKTTIKEIPDKDSPTQPLQEGPLFSNDSKESSPMPKDTPWDESLRKNYNTTIEEILDKDNPTQPLQEGPLFPNNREESSPMQKNNTWEPGHHVSNAEVLVQ